MTILLHFLRIAFGLVEDLDRVLVALGHLPAVEPRHHGHSLEDVGLGQPEDRLALAVDVVEPLGDVARDLQVLLLVLAHRDDVGVVEQDVGRLEHRVGEQAVLGGDPLGLLVLVADALLQPAHRGDARQEPGQLGRLGHVRLDEEGCLLRGRAPAPGNPPTRRRRSGEAGPRRGRWSAHGSRRRSRRRRCRAAAPDIAGSRRSSCRCGGRPRAGFPTGHAWPRRLARAWLGWVEAGPSRPPATYATVSIRRDRSKPGRARRWRPGGSMVRYAGDGTWSEGISDPGSRFHDSARHRDSKRQTSKSSRRPDGHGGGA